jgi:hypothetical protein
VARVGRERVLDGVALIADDDARLEAREPLGARGAHAVKAVSEPEVLVVIIEDDRLPCLPLRIDDEAAIIELHAVGVFAQDLLVVRLARLRAAIEAERVELDRLIRALVGVHLSCGPATADLLSKLVFTTHHEASSLLQSRAS